MRRGRGGGFGVEKVRGAGRLLTLVAVELELRVERISEIGGQDRLLTFRAEGLEMRGG